MTAEGNALSNVQMCSEAINAKLEDYNCAVAGQIVSNSKGNFQLVRVFPNRVTGEDQVDCEARSEKCAAEIKSVMDGYSCAWSVTAVHSPEKMAEVLLNVADLNPVTVEAED